MEQSEQERVKKRNLKVEPIVRRHDEKAFPLETPQHIVRAPYPWEQKYEGKLAKITKEYFRCKGSSYHPAHHTEGKEAISDCKGPEHHSLPMKEGKEFIYPILLDLLNYVQKVTGKKVVITCGHRCPSHNSYADSSVEAQSSKHMLGAEVDFYVQGMENEPQEIVKLLMKYYEENAQTKNHPEYKFSRYEKSDLSLKPWCNKEVFIKLFQKNEGRDFDNRHPYPYISLQVRVDRLTGEKVTFSWAKASSALLRY